MTTLFKKQKNKIEKFICVSKDFSGLGFAKLFIDEGCESIMAVEPDEGDENLDNFWNVGEGIVEVLPFKDVFKNRNDYKDWLWLFDGNHHSAEADKLRFEGFYVLGTYQLTDKMEHEREFGAAMVKKAGLDVPETIECSSIDEGIAVLDADPEKSWVFKPDEPDDEAWQTTVPDAERHDVANEEIKLFLQSQGDGKGNYILQQRMSGVEVNVELFLHKGTPFFAHANLECKKKYNRDMGKLVGCAHDVEWVVPMDSKIIQETVSKLIELPEFSDYTGPVDMNLIVGDKKKWFLEFCCRWGFNSSPNLFLNLAISPVSEILSDWVTGNVSNFGDHFREGFGSSITLRIDKPVYGLPIIVDDVVSKNFYHFDTCVINGQLSLSGYSEEVGIVTGMDYDIHSSAEECLKNLEKIHYPCRAARTDIDQKNYLTNPQERYIALQSMHAFDKMI